MNFFSQNVKNLLTLLVTSAKVLLAKTSRPLPSTSMGHRSYGKHEANTKSDLNILLLTLKRNLLDT